MDYREQRSHTGYFAHGKSEARGRSRHENNNNNNMEKRNVGTKGKSPKQDLTIELPERHESP